MRTRSYENGAAFLEVKTRRGARTVKERMPWELPGTLQLDATGRSYAVDRLTAAGLLRSSRGVGGGLKLARPAAAITLADIVEAVEGPIALTACIEHGRHDCTLEDACAVRPHWPTVNTALRTALAQVSLIDLAQPKQQTSVPAPAIATLEA